MWNSKLKLLRPAYWLWEFTREWLQNAKYCDYPPVLRTWDEWTIFKYVMEVLRQFLHRTQWKSKWHKVTLHQVVTVYSEMFDHMDGVIQSLAKRRSQWNEDLYLAVRFAQHNFCKWYAEGTPTTSILPIFADIRDPFRMLQSCRKWDKRMDIDPADQAFYTTQYQQPFEKFIEHEYCAKHRRLHIIEPDSLPTNNVFSSAMASWSGQSLYDPYGLSSEDEDCLMRNNVAETMPRWSDRAVRLSTDARLHLNALPELPQIWGQIHPNHTDYNSNAMQIGRTFLLRNITDRWHQQEEMNSKYAFHSNVARDVFCIIPPAVVVEARCSLGGEVISKRQSTTTSETLHRKVVIKQCARANNGMLAGDDLALDIRNTENDLEMQKEGEERKLHTMAKVCDLWKCGRVAISNVLHRRNHALKTRKWQL